MGVWAIIYSHVIFVAGGRYFKLEAVESVKYVGALDITLSFLLLCYVFLGLKESTSNSNGQSHAKTGTTRHCSLENKQAELLMAWQNAAANQPQRNNHPHPLGLFKASCQRTSAFCEEADLPCANIPSVTSANCLPCNFLEHVRGM